VGVPKNFKIFSLKGVDPRSQDDEYITPGHIMPFNFSWRREVVMTTTSTISSQSPSLLCNEANLSQFTAKFA
jgi:hypothetical protein